MKTFLCLSFAIVAISSTGFSAADLIVNSSGRLTVHSNITVNAGSFIVQSGGAVDIDLLAKITATNVVYGGTLTVASNDLVLSNGSTFQLFNAPTYSGAFLSVNVPALSPGLVWNSQLDVNGSLVIASEVPPDVQFTVMQQEGTGIALSGTGGTPSGSYVVLTSTNIALPAAQWTVLATNTFDGSGGFTFTNSVDDALPRQFFLLELR